MIPKVGSEVDAYCTKCKMDLLHRVVAVLEATPKRVECQTCHSQHNYRKPKGVAAAKAAKAPKRKGGPVSARAAGTERTRRATKGQLELMAQWEGRISGKGKSDFVKYSVKHAFEVDQLVDHSTFGQGYVSEVHQDRKISVVFRDGEKILAHARG
nr:hypothetical protein [uncultured bacterium]